MRGFPDWRDRSAYPTASSYPDPDPNGEPDPTYPSKAWAWQFLRRNTDYQREYMEWRDSYRGGGGADCARKYGLSLMIPFLEENPESIPFIIDPAPLMHRTVRILRPHEAAFIVDMRLPLSPQLDLFTKAFKDLQERLPKETPARKRHLALSRYLRVLDARASDVNNDEIAAHFIADGTYQSQAYKYKPGDLTIDKDVREAVAYTKPQRYLRLSRSGG